MREHYYPANERLKKYVKYISFYRSDDNEREILVFPNSGAAVALHKEHGFIFQEKNVYRSVNMPGNDTQLLHINRIDPVKVIDKGLRESITIVFNPLGVNHFIRGDLAELVKANNGDPSFITRLPFFNGFAKMVFAENSIGSMLMQVEKFLLSKLTEINIPFVAEAIVLLTDLDHLYSIPDICKHIGTSPRNLTRLFNKHICLSPVEFRNVYQFRYSLNKKVESGSRITFKDIGYESNYTHSSYMIRMYKKYTGLNPSAFFNRLSVEGNYVYVAL